MMFKKIIRITILIFLYIVPGYSQNQPEWITLPDLPESRWGHCSIIYNDFVWNIGGKKDGPNSITGSVDLFNLTTHQWETDSLIPDLNNPRSEATAVVYQDKIFIIGGITSNGILTSVEYFDNVERQWKNFTPVSEPRVGANAIVVNDTLYYIGGINSTEYSSTQIPVDIVEYYDESTASWKKSDKWMLLSPRAWMQTIVIKDDIFIIGGRSISPLNTMETYNVISNAQAISDLPTHRYFFGSVTTGDKIFVFGGRGNTGFLDSIEEYDIRTKNWTKSNITLPTPRAGLGVVYYNDYVYIFGGIDITGSALKSAECIYLNPMTGVNTDENGYQPEQHQLIANYPNPFNCSTTIQYYLASPQEDLKMLIYNVAGEVVQTFLFDRQSQGNHQVTWNGKDFNQDQVSSGIYFARLICNDYSIPILKLTLIK